MHTSHVEKSKRQDRGDDLCAIESSPEERETDRQLLAGVEVRQPSEPTVRNVLKISASCLESNGGILP
jgi:hypothetical protein